MKADCDTLLDNDLFSDPEAFLVQDLSVPLKLKLKQAIITHDSKLVIVSIFNEEQKSNDYKILKFSAKVRKQAEALKKKLVNLQYQDSIGFSHLWLQLKKKIDEDMIPIVGKNCFYDLAYCFSHFERHITKHYQQFKKGIAEILPGGIYDSKIVQSYFEAERGGSAGELKGDNKSENDFDQTVVNFPDERFEITESDEFSTGKNAFEIGVDFLSMARKMDPKTVLGLLNVVTIDPNVLYAYDFGSADTDVPWNAKAWAVVLKNDFAKKIRIQDNKGKKKKEGSIRMIFLYWRINT